MSSALAKRASHAPRSVLLRTGFTSATRSLRIDSISNSITWRRRGSRTTGRGWFNNCCSVSIADNSSNSNSSGDGCSSNSHYIQNDCRNENAVSSNRNEDAGISFSSFTRAPYGGACRGRTRFFVFLPLTLLLSLVWCFCTAERHVGAANSADPPVTRSTPSHQQPRTFRWPLHRSSSSDTLSASPAGGSAASPSPAAEEESPVEEQPFELSSLVTGKNSQGTVKGSSLQRRRKSSGVRSTLRVRLLRRISRKGRQDGSRIFARRKGSTSTESDTGTPPVFDSPTKDQKFFGSGFDRAAHASATTPGFSGEMRRSSSQSSGGCGTPPSTPDTPLSEARLRRRQTATFQVLAGTVSKPRGSTHRIITRVPLQRNEASTADLSGLNEEEEGQDQQENQLRDEEQQQQTEQNVRRNPSARAERGRQVPVELPPLSSTGPRDTPASQRQPSGDTATSCSSKGTSHYEEELPFPPAVANSALVKKSLELARRLSLSPYHSGVNSVSKIEQKRHRSVSLCRPETPSGISAADGKQKTGSCGAEKGGEDDASVEANEQDLRAAYWETMRTAVGDFHETRRLAGFTLRGIEDACARQHRNIDAFISRWVTEGALPQTTRSEMLSLVKAQTHIFLLLKEADIRCKRTQTELQHTEDLYKLLRRSEEHDFSEPQRGAVTREAAAPAQATAAVEIGQQAASAANADAEEPAASAAHAHDAAPTNPVSGVGGLETANVAAETAGTASSIPVTAAAATAGDSSDDDSEEFSLPSPRPSSADSSPSLAWTEPDDVPEWRKNTFFNFGNLRTEDEVVEESEEEVAQRRLESIMQAVRLEALSKRTQCVAIKEEVSYTYKRLLYWLTVLQTPELRKALLEEGAASASEKELVAIKKGSREALSPYIRRKASPSEAGGQTLPEGARKLVEFVEYAANTTWKIFEGLRQRQYHLDVWLSYLATGHTTVERVLGEIHGLNMVQEEGRGNAQSLLMRLQIQQHTWPSTVAAVDQQLREQFPASGSPRSSTLLWDSAKELVIGNVELYYLLQATEATDRRLRFWEKTLSKIYVEKEERKQKVKE